MRTDLTLSMKVKADFSVFFFVNYLTFCTSGHVAAEGKRVDFRFKDFISD